MNNIWYSFDFETSSSNKYACEIDRVCVCEFDVETGKVDGAWDFKAPSRCKVASDLATGLPSSDLMCIMSSFYPKVAHNADFDLYLMEHRLGIKVNGPVYDTYLMAKHWRNDLQAYDLKTLAWLLFGDTYQPLLRLKEWIYENKIKGEPDPDLGFDMTQPPDKLVHDYCIHDVDVTARLARYLYPKVKDIFAHEQDTQYIRLNMEIQANGITIDKEGLKRELKNGLRRVKYNKGNARDKLGVDKKKSPMGNALEDHLAEIGETEKTKTGKVKKDAPALRRHKKDTVVRSVILAKKAQDTVVKFARNILDVVGDGNTFHPNLIQSGAVTRRHRAVNMYGDNGRIAKGQTQNIPRGEGIRSYFVAPPGYAVAKHDLASIEARMFSSFMELLMGESVFADLYRKQKDFNPYLWVIERCTGHGEVSKKHELYIPYKHAVLGRLYCSGSARLAVQLRDNFELDYTEDDCFDIYRSIDRACPFIKRFQRFLLKLSERQGYLMDPFGAVYNRPSKDYEIIAHLHQGAAGNVLKWWGLAFAPLMADSDDYVWNIVHDEYDMAIKRDRKARGRLNAYGDVLKGLDLFDLPIVAEHSGLQDNWAACA